MSLKGCVPHMCLQSGDIGKHYDGYVETPWGKCEIESVSHNVRVASSNMLTLISDGKPSAKIKKLGLNMIGRSEIIQKQCHKARIHIVGIQEARTSGPSQRQSKNYLIISGGYKTTKGSGAALGCEVWIARKLRDTERNTHDI